MSNNPETEETASVSAVPTAAERDMDDIERMVNRISDVRDVKKIYQFTHIKELKRENVRYWLDAMEEQLELQDAWRAVRACAELGAIAYGVLLDKKTGWRKLDLKDRAIMKAAMSENARLNYKSVKTAAELWKKIKEDYGKVTMADRVQAILAVINWKKDPSMNVIQALEDFERLDHERQDVTSSTIDKESLMCIFLMGLGSEYTEVRQNIFSSGAISRAEVLTRLQNSEIGKPSGEEKARRTATKNKNIRCWNCQKRGHRASECTEKKNDDNDSDSDSDADHDRTRNRRRKNKNVFDKKAKSRRNKGGNSRRPRARRAKESSEESESNEYSDISEQADQASDILFEYCDRSHRSLEATPRRNADKWCLDSGATSHCTGNVELFFELDRKQRGFPKNCRRGH